MLTKEKMQTAKNYVDGKKLYGSHPAAAAADDDDDDDQCLLSQPAILLT